jgi:hypothetical protein
MVWLIILLQKGFVGLTYIIALTYILYSNDLLLAQIIFHLKKHLLLSLGICALHIKVHSHLMLSQC